MTSAKIDGSYLHVLIVFRILFFGEDTKAISAIVDLRKGDFGICNAGVFGIGLNSIFSLIF